MTGPVDNWHEDCPACDTEPTEIHRCRTVLWTASGWVVTSACHFGMRLNADPPVVSGPWPMFGGVA